MHHLAPRRAAAAMVQAHLRMVQCDELAVISSSLSRRSDALSDLTLHCDAHACLKQPKASAFFSSETS